MTFLQIICAIIACVAVILSLTYDEYKERMMFLLTAVTAMVVAMTPFFWG